MPRFGLLEISDGPLGALFVLMPLVAIELAAVVAEDIALGVGPPGAAHGCGTGLRDPKGWVPSWLWLHGVFPTNPKRLN